MGRVLIPLFLFISICSFSQTPDNSDSLLTENAVFEKVDVEASFPGGLEGWRRYLEKNLSPRVPIDNGAPVGIYTIIVQFIVDRNGILSDIRTLTNFGYGMELEVRRIIQQSPQWIPAKQNGRTVKAYRKQPVTFVVEDGEVDIFMKEKYILYAGEDNIVKIRVPDVKEEHLVMTLSPGTIKPGDNGNYHLRVNNAGKAILHISNGKKNKPISSVYFIVKKK